MATAGSAHSLYARLVRERDQLLHMEEGYHRDAQEAIFESKGVAESVRCCINHASSWESGIRKLEKDPTLESYYDWDGPESCSIYHRDKIVDYKLELAKNNMEKEKLQKELDAKKEFIVKAKADKSKTRRKINRIIGKIEGLRKMWGFQQVDVQ